MSNIYDFSAQTVGGKDQPMSDYQGKVLLVVNTASKCGFTPQFEGLEELYEKYRDKGLEILGFPCNQFRGQEPGTEKEIKEFCEVNFDVDFPMTEKQSVEGADGQKLTEKRLRYRRVPVNHGDTVKSGEVVQVELKVTSDNDYTYLAFEDMKPAGCEPMELRSGGRWAGGLCPHLELRDEKVVFFIGLLEQGTHVLRYKLRAETPGRFHALPTTGFAMYAPEVRAISDEMRLEISDRE